MAAPTLLDVFHLPAFQERLFRDDAVAEPAQTFEITMLGVREVLHTWAALRRLCRETKRSCDRAETYRALMDRCECVGVHGERWTTVQQQRWLDDTPRYASPVLSARESLITRFLLLRSAELVDNHMDARGTSLQRHATVITAKLWAACLWVPQAVQAELTVQQFSKMLSLYYKLAYIYGDAVTPNVDPPPPRAPFVPQPNFNIAV